ncbi:SdiA-regulated domain-containing protein [Flavobacterium sp. RHBU_3]|uniref:SdiA-regulated domain-containing protein n=1 Tax=Flavobacterium sp. RHBU_3 TaxID=3391184 RepID=UPI003984EF65
MKKVILYTAIAFSALQLQAQKVEKLKPVKKVDVKVDEPSDICLNAAKDAYWIVGDGGVLFEVNFDGTVRRQAEYQGLDCEGVYADDKFVYVAEELSRKVRVFDAKTLKIVRTVPVAYNGGRNRAYEGIAYNKVNDKFLLVTEKSPIYLFELDKDFRVVNEITLTGIAKDISAVTYYNNSVWLLSDESMMVFRLNPADYSVTGKWKLPVLNPEGLVFDAEGNMIVLSDDMQTIYQFTNPEKQQ